VKAIGYLRVSTDRQAEKGLGIPEQEAALRAWAKAGGHRLVALYRDEGESGSNGLDTREGLADALGALRDGKAEALVVARLDRLARDLVLQEQLLAEVRRLGAVLCSAAGGEDAYLVDDATDPDPEAEAQPVEADLEKHVPVLEGTVGVVDGTDDRGVGELVVPHEPSGRLPTAARNRRSRRLGGQRLAVVV